MKRRTRSVVLSLVLAIVFVFAFTLTACHTGDANVITLDKTDLNLSVGEEYTLTANCDPESAAKDLTWSSDNTSVVTVTDGKVTGVGCGNATVWAEAKNGIRGYCNVTVKQVWQWAIENTVKQTNYTVQTVEDLGMGFDNGGTYFEMFGMDVTHTAKVAADSNLYSVSSVTTMTQEGEPLEGSLTDLRYGVREGNTAYSYYAKNYGTNAVSWSEGSMFENDTNPAERFAEMAAGAAFDSFTHGFNDSNGNYVSLMYLPDNAIYDASANKLTVTGLTTDWTFLDPEGGSITKQFDAEIEITFENGIVKKCVLNLSRTYSYYEIFQSNPSNGEPENLLLCGEITAEVVYGNAQVSIPSADQEAINQIKVNRPLAKAFNALSSDVLNFTMYEQKTTTGQNLTTAKYSVGKDGGVYSSVGVSAKDCEYLDITVNGTEASAVNYYKDGNTWYKKTIDGKGLSDTTAHKSLNHYFFIGDRENPDWSEASISSMYGSFTAGENNTYTATLSQYLGEDNGFVDCDVTVKLDSQGRLSSVEYDYGSSEDGEEHINLKYIFTAYGSTQASVPQSVIDQAKEVGSSEDSVIAKAFEKLSNNTASFDMTYQLVNSANPEYNKTENETFDASSAIKRNVSSDSGTTYYKLVSENGENYRYNYYKNSGVWVYNKQSFGSDSDYALSYLAHIDLSNGNYASSQGGAQGSLSNFYWAFELSGTAYTANNLFAVLWNSDLQSYDYLPCTVTISLDGDERMTSLTITKSGEVEEYAITYDSVSVTLPTEVENAQEMVEQSQSTVGQAFIKLNENTDSLVMQYQRENSSNSNDNRTITETIDVSSRIRKSVENYGSGDSTSYSRLVSENGQYYKYDYNYNRDFAVWTYYKNETYGEDEYVLRDFARIQLSHYSNYMYCYSLTDGGDTTDLTNLYWAFSENGDAYVANVYYVDSVYNQDQDEWVYTYISCTVTLKLDGNGRLTSLKMERAGYVEEYTFTYGSASVTLPAEVDNAKEYVNQSDSEIYNAFEGLTYNQSSVTVEYTCTDHNATENGVTTGKQTVNVDSMKSETAENGVANSYVRIEVENGGYVLYEYRNYGDGWYCYRAEYGDDHDFALQCLASLNFHTNLGSFTVTQDSENSYYNPGDFYLLYNKTGNVYTANLYKYEEEWNGEAGENVRTYTPCTVSFQLDGSGRLTSLTVEINDGADVHVTHQYTVTYGAETVTVPDDVLAVQPQQ